MVREAEEPGALGAQPHDVEQGLPRVVGAAAASAGSGRREQPVADIGPGERRECGLAGGQHQRDEPAVEAPRTGRLAGRGTRAVVEPIELALVDEVQREVVRVGEEVLLEGRRQRRQLGVQLGQAGAGVGIERGAAEHGLAMDAFEQVRLVGIECQLVAHAVQQADPGEEPRVQPDGIVMGSEDRGELSLEGVDRLVGVGRARVLEDGQHPAQELARAFEREEGVLERRRRRIVGDGVDVGVLLAHAEFDRLPVVLRPYECEERQPVGEGAGFEEWIRRVAHPTTI
jgi:hypothetical protein